MSPRWQSAGHDWHGTAWIGEHVHGAQTVLFPDSAHAIFHDEPDRFVSSVLDFVERVSPRDARTGSTDQFNAS